VLASGAAYQKNRGVRAAVDASENAQEQCLLLPLFHELTREQQEFIATQLRSVLAASAWPERD